MTGWEWFFLIVFLITITMLFFAAFGGSNLTEQSVEEYMARLMKESTTEKK